MRTAGVEVSLDGAAIAAAFTPLASLDGVAYEYAHVSVTPGAHVIESSEAFGISIVGYAQDVSYGYVGGSGVEEIGVAPPPPVG
jgi:hypothetical protein